ncbi:hypothetical protein [Geotalea sp. SG265]|uniref:hypothetical protein n=1 Tax=Geotalea sp. SG265 TaxID=2922867 RepID=UPI001FB025FC|nr:hypothetical protein [Geotalea sp. SG265]
MNKQEQIGDEYIYISSNQQLSESVKLHIRSDADILKSLQPTMRKVVLDLNKQLAQLGIK